MYIYTHMYIIFLILAKWIKTDFFLNRNFGRVQWSNMVFSLIFLNHILQYLKIKRVFIMFPSDELSVIVVCKLPYFYLHHWRIFLPTEYIILVWLLFLFNTLNISFRYLPVLIMFAWTLAVDLLAAHLKICIIFFFFYF